MCVPLSHKVCAWVKPVCCQSLCHVHCQGKDHAHLPIIFHQLSQSGPSSHSSLLHHFSYLTFTIPRKSLHREVCPAGVQCLSWSVMEEFQASEAPPPMLLPASLFPFLGSWVESSIEDPESLWHTPWLRIPRVWTQADVCGSTLRLVAHLEKLEPKEPEPECKEPALGRTMEGQYWDLCLLGPLSCKDTLALCWESLAHVILLLLQFPLRNH